MNRRRKITGIVFLAMCAVFIMLHNPANVQAADLQPLPQINMINALQDTSELVVTDSGYMRVFFDEENWIIIVEYYDNEFNITGRRSVNLEFGTWGGFYAGEDAYYIVEGCDNDERDDTAEVIRVIRYNTRWERTGAANITSDPDIPGGSVIYPFDGGCVEMAEYNGTLYIVTGHVGYSNSQHQGFLMAVVDEESMTGEIIAADLGHSYAQYIVGKDSYMYILEQSEGSRCTSLKRVNTQDVETGNKIGYWGWFPGIAVLKYGGERTSSMAIPCYATVDGLAVSSDCVLGLGTSIDQSLYDSVTENTAYNLYLTVTSVSDFTSNGTSVKWLTDYKDDGHSFFCTHITKVNENRFMISWEEYDDEQEADTDDVLSCYVSHYIFVDGAGNTVSDKYTVAAPLSECQPIVNGSKIVYYVSCENMVNFYTIDAYSGAFSKKTYRVAGENVSWNLDGDVLTFSGSGKLSVNMDSRNDNAWNPIRDKVKKIVIGKGITGIANNQFNYFSNLTEVVIKPGLTSIGDQAFAYCKSLTKITIPYTVTSIGDDILWTGSSWVGSNGTHVVRATIYCYAGTAAERYAKKNNISYVLLQAKGTPYQTGKYTVGGCKYEITKVAGSGQGTVKVASVPAKKKKVSIPAAVKIHGYTYKVTEIGENAFSGNKKIKTVVLGENVKTIGASAFQECTSLKSFVCKSTKLARIGKNAFYGDRSLKSITLETRKLTKKKVGTNAFTGIKASCVIKVPADRTTAYKRIFKARGAGNRVRVRKNRV